MHRRNFLSLFGVTAATIAADPEALLWVPGKKLISVPSVIAPTDYMTLDEFRERYMDAYVAAIAKRWNPRVNIPYFAPPWEPKDYSFLRFR
jgi:hypothetical protein